MGGIEYSEELVAKICERIAMGESLLTICKDSDMPSTVSFYRWLDEHEELRNKYARARTLQAEYYVEQCIEIADDNTNDSYKDDEGNRIIDHEVIARSRLRVDTRKWYASKIYPKKYGEKLDLTAQNTNLNAEIAFDVSKLDNEQLPQFIQALQKVLGN